MTAIQTVTISDLARRTRAVVERVAREPGARLVVTKNKRPVAVISGIKGGRTTQRASALDEVRPGGTWLPA